MRRDATIDATKNSTIPYEFYGGGHSHSLQCSCLENAMDRGAWWAIVHRVMKSQTLLKRLSTHAFDFYVKE